MGGWRLSKQNTTVETERNVSAGSSCVEMGPGDWTTAHHHRAIGKRSRATTIGAWKESFK